MAWGIILIAAVSLFSCTAASTDDGILKILTYDSFVSEWGPGQTIIDGFKSSTGTEVQITSVGDAGTVLSTLIQAGKNPGYDLVIGLDNNQIEQARGILEPYKAKGWDTLPAEVRFDASGSLTPYDYGYFSIIYDSEKISVPPASLEDLTKPEYAKSLILMDPRTSTPGLGFLLWTVSIYGDDFAAYWKRLSPSILTVTAGWDEGYGLFTKGEAPLVLSYTTSPAYHLAFEETSRYKAAVFAQGHYVQIEGAGILKYGHNKTQAKAFLDYLLTPAAQDVLPLTNFMYPSTPITLPESFSIAPKPSKTLSLPDVSPARIRNLTETWLNVMSGTVK